MDPQIIGFIGIGVLFLLLFIGMPIAFALAFTGFWGIAFITDIEVALPTLVRSFNGTFTTYSFTVIPLFVIMGELATVSGLSQGYTPWPIDCSEDCRVVLQSQPLEVAQGLHPSAGHRLQRLQPLAGWLCLK